MSSDAVAAAGIQRAGFEAQLHLAASSGMPLFLHNRATGGDFARVMRAAIIRDDAGAGSGSPMGPGGRRTASHPHGPIASGG